MEFNWIILFFASFIPLIIGLGWFHPKVFGSTWQKTVGHSEDVIKSGNKTVLILLCYFFSLLMTVAIMSLVIHQFSILGVLEGSPGFYDDNSDVQKYLSDFMSRYGNNHRNFGHGMVHGVIASVTFALPLIAINGLLERRGWKYIWILFGYWLLSLVFMGGVICHFM